MNLYVYYRVKPGTETQCRAAVAAVQTELGMPHRLLRRADDPATWMEIYEDVDASFATRLEAAASRLGLTEILGAGARHLERFVACA